jgi:hypothetical protein
MQPGNLAFGFVFESPVRVVEVVEDNIEFFAVDFFQVCTACRVISSQHAPKSPRSLHHIQKHA